MTDGAVQFAGLSLVLPPDWFDITHDLPEGSPPTLAKPEGIGALQFSVARYHSDVRPHLGVEDLRDLLMDFAARQNLDEPTNISEHAFKVPCVSGDFAASDEFIRAWYASRSDGGVVFVTYVTQDVGSDALSAELSESERIVASIDG